MSLPPYKLLLQFGLVIAAAVFVYWTALGYLRFGTWTPDGLSRAAFSLGAVLLLVGVVRCARWVDERGGP